MITLFSSNIIILLLSLKSSTTYKHELFKLDKFAEAHHVDIDDFSVIWNEACFVAVIFEISGKVTIKSWYDFLFSKYAMSSFTQ